ncbi:uncharacterized protein B0I36DRAFT_399230 [Microdochium trichocladiopsis]|uniref:Chromo domain-containing protein n=1 Tax=Microdochium trichocladiopsis TaxID=1682393 RepID=A0A9P9BIR8_9PEZI|nr:uncharacterized protein B0I36DRAFT_399230 [Microdochium trichocladiopsis]KAH7012578.1 hypothetical protein B0I36DRAFT_399230 [Microdochium trichocladiopsis]
MAISKSTTGTSGTVTMNVNRETVTHEASVEHIKEDPPQQGRSPEESVMLANGAGDSRQQSVEYALTLSPISSAQSSNGAAGLSTDATSNALPTGCSNASSQDAPELPPDEPPHPCGQAADSHDSARSDGGVSPDLPMDDADDDSTLPDEWEGKIIGEEADGYLVAWKSSFIPKEFAGEAMIRAWEEQKAKILAGGGERKGTGLKQPATIKGRVEKRGAGKRGRGRQGV